jgi:uncharacterized protein YbbK (DUF523 family)
MLTICISSCLLGYSVRYDGRALSIPSFVGILKARAKLLPVCPEFTAGLSVPREPMDLFAAKDSTRLLGLETGTDYTGLLVKAAEEIASLAHRRSVSGFVLKSNSPSCGRGTAGIRTDGAARSTGDGLFVRYLEKRFPGMPFADERTLNAPGAADAFLRLAAARRKGERPC